ncbi:tRNA 2-selenouridine synthase [Tamilnaduibacter salinus]|uniref:tRNA 2-selenouridine synthase n=1 Tax=Tamilnaduibacter salinus TaxID=1484056 RepID=A0A2U1CWI9_9GAMM|nr:tRNA 2-selenouridine(34) synthase MnmH [Tamilnaduibacter salinus]PVY76313.1 tRNA 2-selenouridine synthase [Tamilnaduibacter salinus]
MTRRADTDDFRALFLNDVPLMDVRAPTEFQKGSFPLAINAPLMNDEERHRVGIRYKEQGQSSAIDLGHQLVRDDLRQERVNQWVRFANSNPDGYLFCFRGGLRSRIVQEWMAEAGMDYPLIKGGYKALRRFLIDELEAICQRMPIILVSGRTGTGKTRLLDELPNPVDLEGMANHRGSSFGRTLTPQPSQIDFENRLTVAMMKAWHHGQGPAFLEDESGLIGRCRLPDGLRERMAQAPMVILERPLDERVGIILQDYVTDMVTAFVDRDGHDAGWMNFREHLLSALDRIRKRLGGARHQALRAIMERALDRQQDSGDVSDHRDWIIALLRDYYDPMYDYQLGQREGRILAQDSAERLRQWAASEAPAAMADRTVAHSMS